MFDPRKRPMKRLGRIETTMRRPTIGRIVRVYLPPTTVPAIVTRVLSSDGDITCTAFIPYGTGTAALAMIPYDPEKHAGTWHWPDDD